MKKIVILQTVVPDYRKKVFQFIKNYLGDSFLLYGGNEYFEDSVKSDNSITFLNKVNNKFWFDRKVLFQTGMWNESIKSDVLVLELNPRIISNWLLLTFRYFSPKKTILWGHAWPRKGKESGTDKIRNTMRLLADEIIVYTKTQEKELKKKMPKKVIKSAPNAIFHNNEMIVSKIPNEKITDIIYVGRLTKSKKIIFLVKSFIKMIDRLPKKTKLIIIGEGEEKLKIIDLITQNDLKERILVMGHIGDYTILKELYSKSLFSVSPGYIGLSIIQSFGFGVPMLISKYENHSPEIEAIEEGHNAEYFKTNSIDDLALKMNTFFDKKVFWIEQRPKICSQCRIDYSIENMANKFIELL